jgi:hypothetical protein
LPSISGGEGEILSAPIALCSGDTYTGGKLITSGRIVVSGDGKSRTVTMVIERVHLELPAVQKEIRRVHEGRRSPLIVLNNSQTRLFTDSSEV